MKDNSFYYIFEIIVDSGKFWNIWKNLKKIFRKNIAPEFFWKIF
jgi:hypothetical protein